MALADDIVNGPETGNHTNRTRDLINSPDTEHNPEPQYRASSTTLARGIITGPGIGPNTAQIQGIENDPRIGHHSWLTNRAKQHP